MGYQIYELDIGTLPVEDLAPILEVSNAVRTEQAARTAPRTADDLRLQANLPGFERRWFVARANDGSVVGLGNTEMADDGSNLEILGLDLAVPQQNRRQQIGTALLAHGLAIAQDAGRPRLVGHVYDSVPSGRAFVESFGAVAGMDLHVNSCAVNSLEWGALEAWADDAPAGYTRQVIDGTWPEELFEKSVPLFEILERDAPTGDDYQARAWTAERIKRSHDLYLSTADSILAIAIEDSSSDLAGISHLIRRHSDPHTWQVTFTMVDPDHRGHGIGRWLKGAINLRAREVWPDGHYTETMNAFANAPMLAINNAMGFTHEYTMTEMSANVSNVRAALAD